MDKTGGIETLPSLTETVREHGLGANKKLGQHFLLDMNLTDKIARLADPLNGVSVAEIGPGPGGLTRALLLRGATKVVAIEWTNGSCLRSPRSAIERRDDWRSRRVTR